MKLGVRIDRKIDSPEVYAQRQVGYWDEQVRKHGISHAYACENDYLTVVPCTDKGKESVWLNIDSADIAQWLLTNHAGKFPAAEQLITQHGYLHATVFGEPYVQWESWYCTHGHPLKKALELRAKTKFDQQEGKQIAALLKATLNKLLSEFSLELKSYCWQYNLLGAVY